MKAAIEAHSFNEVEKMRKRVDELWDKKEYSEKKKTELEIELQTATKRCCELSEENGKLKFALQEVIDHHKKIENVNDDRSKLKEEVRRLQEVIATMIPKDDILVYKESIDAQERRCKELMLQRDHFKQLLLNMVNETKETFQMAIENEHKNAERFFDSAMCGSELCEFLSIANTELAHLSDTLDRVKKIYRKYIIKQRACTWKKNFILDELWTEFLPMNDVDVPLFLRCNLKLVVNLPSTKEVNVCALCQTFLKQNLC
jgi:chromosome segregation ATPase